MQTYRDTNHLGSLYTKERESPPVMIYSSYYWHKNINIGRNEELSRAVNSLNRANSFLVNAIFNVYASVIVDVVVRFKSFSKSYYHL